MIYKLPPFSAADEEVIERVTRTLRQRVIDFHRQRPISEPMPLDLHPPTPTPRPTSPKEISVAVALRLQKPATKLPRSYLPPDASAPDVGSPRRY
jgi:hypothetical protein